MDAGVEAESAVLNIRGEHADYSGCRADHIEGKVVLDMHVRDTQGFVGVHTVRQQHFIEI